MQKRGHLRGVLHKLKRKGLTPKYQFSGLAEKKKAAHAGTHLIPWVQNNRTVVWLRILIHVKITFTTERFSSNRGLSYACAQDYGIARGEYCKSLQRSVWRGVVSPLKKQCLWT